jgi:hypothetical protein
MRDAEVVDLDLVGREQQCVVVKSVGNTGYRGDDQRLLGLAESSYRDRWFKQHIYNPAAYILSMLV